MGMQLVLRRDWEAIDGSTGKSAVRVVIPAGTHEIERVPNPAHFEAPWLVLKGTLIGASELSWRQWKNGVLASDPRSSDFGKPINWGEYEVVILNDDTPVFGYVIMNASGQTLSRDLFWGSNTVPNNGYVHTQESLDIIRVCSVIWDFKPTVVYPGTYFDGQVEVSDPLPFTS